MGEAKTAAHADDIATLARRVLAHYQARTTDQADSPMAVPIAAYNDPDRYQLEVDRIFRRLPLALALSLELPSPKSYVAMTVVGVPVIMVRAEDGIVRAFLNTCRHRGAPVCENGAGSVTHFSCPYHAWSYDTCGQLVAMYGSSTFGDIDRASHSLIELPCAERAGLIWVALKPDAQFDVDEWLGDFADELETVKLHDWHLVRQTDIEGPGWKFAWDGYLDFYHHNILHQKTVGKYAIGNLLLHNTYGPHQRIVTPRKSLKELVGVPEEQWEADKHIRKVHSVFPNVSISGLVGGHCLISHVFPGTTPDRTVTRQTILAAHVPTTPEEKQATEEFCEAALLAVRDEDYKMGFRIQAGLKWGGNKEFVFGRNEPVLQHYHKWVARFAAMD